MASRTILFWLGFCVITGAASFSFASAESPVAPPPRAKKLTDKEIARLIGNLSSDGFTEREEATEKLKRRPEAAIALLRANRIEVHPEARRRLATILPVMMSRELAEKRLDQLPEYVKKRQLDRIVETMVACREFIRTQDDDQIRAFVKDVYQAATGGKTHEPTARDYPTFKSFAAPNRVHSVQDPTAIDYRTTMGYSAVIASERIDGMHSVQHSIALCNGDVDLDRGGVSGGFVFATGIVSVVSADAAFIVTPREIHVGTGGSSSVLVTASRVFAYGDQRWPNDRSSIILEQDKDFFRSWSLVSPGTIGLRTCSLFGVLSVLSVKPNSPAHQCGLKRGDIILDVNGIRISNVAEFNRLICRTAVTWGSSLLGVARGGNFHEVVLPID